MIKVLMLLPNLCVASGVTSFVMNYYRRLDFSKISIDFVVFWDFPNPFEEEIKKKGGKVFHLSSIKKIFSHYQECKKIIEKGNYDIVHNNTLHVTLPLMFCAKMNKVPVRLLHSHSTKVGETKLKAKRNKIFMPLLKYFATDYAACSEVAGSTMFGNSKYTLIPNVIQTEKFAYNEAVRKEIRDKNDCQNKFVIGTVGRIASPKNPFFALRVIKKVLEKRQDIEYWWIGDGYLQEAVIEYSKKLKIYNSIKFWGAREDIIDLYQAMDAFLLTSFFEGLGIVVVEAQSLGIPCIVSDAVPKEVSYSDLVSFISLQESEEIWADKVLSELNRKTNRKDYSTLLANSQFSDYLAGENLSNYYLQLIHSKNTSK